MIDMSKNNITGDDLKSRPNSKAFDENFDKIFRANKRAFEQAIFCYKCLCPRAEVDPGLMYRCPICKSEAWL
jgi:hypothetical protein